MGQFSQTVAAQEALTRTLGERLEALEKRMGENLAASAKQTGETFVSITERLTVIDAAQKNISELSTHVVSLKAIFSDKQARGAISQDQMEAIVAEHLAPDQYEFQATLVQQFPARLRHPHSQCAGAASWSIPNSRWKRSRSCASPTPTRCAKRRWCRSRNDIQKHVKDIAEKYLIPGEVQTPAIMFVPSDFDLCRTARQLSRDPAQAQGRCRW